MFYIFIAVSGGCLFTLIPSTAINIAGKKSVRPEGLVGGPLFRRWSSADWISSFIPPERGRKKKKKKWTTNSARR